MDTEKDICVLNDAELLGPTKHSELTKYPKTHPEKGPIKLQDHGFPVRFRSIWVRKIPAEKPEPPTHSAPDEKPATTRAAKGH